MAFVSRSLPIRAPTTNQALKPGEKASRSSKKGTDQGPATPKFIPLDLLLPAARGPQRLAIGDLMVKVLLAAPFTLALVDQKHGAPTWVTPITSISNRILGGSPPLEEVVAQRSGHGFLAKISHKHALTIETTGNASEAPLRVPVLCIIFDAPVDALLPAHTKWWGTISLSFKVGAKGETTASKRTSKRTKSASASGSVARGPKKSSSKSAVVKKKEIRAKGSVGQASHQSSKKKKHSREKKRNISGL